MKGEVLTKICKGKGMNKFIYSLIVLAMLLPICSCGDFFENDFYVINVDNKSENLVYSICRYDGKFQKQNGLKIDSVNYHIMAINEKSVVRYIGMEENPEEVLSPSDTISIFFLKKEDFESKTWKQLVDSSYFCQVYHLSGNDIRRLGSNVPFPPTSAMSDMDIVPAYGE